jgi:hypothetical protein
MVALNAWSDAVHPFFQYDFFALTYVLLLINNLLNNGNIST